MLSRLGDRENQSFAEAIPKNCLLTELKQASLWETIVVLDDLKINFSNLLRNL